MKKFVLANIAIILVFSVKAQLAIPVGKQLQLITKQTLSNTTSIMGQDVDIKIENNLVTAAEVKAATNTSVTLNATIKKVSGSISGMGQEQQFDSDAKDPSNNPMLGSIFKDLNKTEEVVLKLEKTAAKSLNMPLGMENMASVTLQDLIMPVEAIGKPELHKWTSEFSGTDGSKSATIYTVSKVTNSEIEITINETANLTGNVQQMGMDLKQNITGTKTTILLYDAMSKMLKTSVQKLDFTGTMEEVMGTNAPIKLNGTITISVQ
ncbi:MAG: hypothetical protein ACOVNY_11295 [Chitinophagaceae bacterium]